MKKTVLGSECVLSQLFCLYESLSLILTERKLRKRKFSNNYITGTIFSHLSFLKFEMFKSNK